MKSLNNPSILEHSGSAPIFINSGHNFVNCDDFKTGLLFQYSLNLLYFYSILLTYEWEKKIFTYFFTLLKCSSETKMYSVLALTRFKAAFKVLVLSILLVLSVLYLLCLFLCKDIAFTRSASDVKLASITQFEPFFNISICGMNSRNRKNLNRTNFW